MSVKLEGFVKPFKGKNDNWDVFSSKFDVLAEVSGWDTNAKKMARLPLFLEGDAYLVFSRMPEADRKDKEKVRATMIKSFNVSKSEAYSKFKCRQLRQDESVDAFAADLRRLLSLAGHNDEGDKDAVVIEQMLAGVPVEVSQQVRLSFAGKDLTVSGCSDAVRALMAAAPGAVVAAASGGHRDRTPSTSRSTMCFRCGEVGHVRRNCPQAKRGGVKSDRGAKPESRKIVCFFCDKEGHTKADCRERKAWLASKKEAVACADEKSEDLCLCTIAVPGRLPRIYVDVAACDVENSQWTRGTGVIDTGCMRTLVSVVCR